MKTLFDGFLKIKELFREGKRYEIMDRGNSVTVLLVKPGLSFEGDQFYIGEQYRAGANSNQHTQVAGMIDSLPEGGHESPREAAFREAMEEAGALGRMEFMYSGYTSPGGCTEHTYQYVMFVDTMSTPTDATEEIQWEWFTGEHIKELGQFGGFASMQLQNAINTYRLNREKFVKGI